MENAECVICSNIYDTENRRPKNLPCGHIFCNQCMATEITNGKRICPICRKPHNVNSVEELPTCILVERLIGQMQKLLGSLGAKSNDSENDEEDDFSEGACLVHKKSLVYFYCETHALKICRECTVLDHPVIKCNIISFKEKIERGKNYSICLASSTAIDIDETLSALGEFVTEKYKNISMKELKIQQWKKATEDATKAIDNYKIAIEKAQNEISKGIVKRKAIEATKQTLKNAKTKKMIVKGRNDIEAVSSNISKWLQDVVRDFDDLHKIVNVVFFWKDPFRKPNKFNIWISADAAVEELKRKLCDRTNVSSTYMVVFEMFKSKILKIFSEGTTLVSVVPTDTIMAYEVYNEHQVGEAVVEIAVIQRRMQPDAPSRCSYCSCNAIPGAKLRRCMKCYRAAYCDEICQRNHWTNHRFMCKLVPEPVGCPFIVSLPESSATYSRLTQIMEAYARYSVDVFQPPSMVTESPAGTQLFDIRPVNSQGQTLERSIGQVLEDKGDEPLDLSDKYYLAMDWKTNEQLPVHCLVQDKMVDCAAYGTQYV